MATRSMSLRAKRSNLKNEMTKKTTKANKYSSSEVKRSRKESSRQAPPKAGQARTIKTAVKTTGLTVRVFDIAGRSAGTISLPKETFGQKPNPRLLAQAIRVYQANAKPKTAHTKTRGEVRGGGVKPWRQKGTGRARAGSRRSPLWVGGGTTFGPRTRDTKLALPKKMRRKALIYALSSKVAEGNIKVISNLEKITPKTKIVAALLTKIAAKKPLIIISGNPPVGGQNVKLAARNIPNVAVDTVANLNAYEVLKCAQILLSKEAVGLFKLKKV